MRYLIICAIGYVLALMLCDLVVDVAERELRHIW
jgi:hypothetical protein